MFTRYFITAVVASLGAAAFASPPGFNYVGQWGKHGFGYCQFNLPYGVAVAPKGNVYVSDTWNHRVQYFKPTGSFLGKWGSEGMGKGKFMLTGKLGISPTGLVYVPDVYTACVQYFTANGSFLGKWDLLISLLKD